ncbi:cytochrome P450 [Streptomyces alkaliphilus]|uniref:cytochrome P450 n=1 Tax=Streptomyces alkaliphilus TaxID=1472722 RepID=UPI002B1F733F|nr:cytochrome P450 [Streptomyces alkaliphilus]
MPGPRRPSTSSPRRLSLSSHTPTTAPRSPTERSPGKTSSRRPCAGRAPSCTCRCVTPWRTSTSATACSSAGGEAILLAFGAAGRDPALHGATADDFDPTRADKEHLAFGHGVHYCLGAPLARMEADIALRSLFARFPHMRLAVPRTELRPQQSFIANSHQELPVILDPTVRPR